MSGTKKKRRTWYNTFPTEGETNEEKSKTMPGMEINPRTIIENHVRGINPITGAVLDKGIYYGENILPTQKDLTYEELRTKRAELERKATDLVNASNDKASSDNSTIQSEN